MPELVGGPRLTAALLELSDTVDDGPGPPFDPAAHLVRLADRCVELLGARAAAVSLADPAGLPDRLLCTGPEPADVVRELADADVLGGPARETLETGCPVPGVRLTGAAAAARWPAFTALARRHGIVTAHAVPLRRRGALLGAVSVLGAGAEAGAGAGAEAGAEAELAGALADAAAIGLLQHRAFAEQRELARQLQRALTGRVRIEQAKGMLAERWSTTPDAAFEALRRHARRSRTRLERIADAVVRGELDGEPGLRPQEPGS
jgi:hypothetical protein